MKRLVVASLLFMAWAYYELSGGSGFVPEAAPEVAVAEAAPEVAPEVAVAEAGPKLTVAGAAPEDADAAALDATGAEVTRAEAAGADSLALASLSLPGSQTLPASPPITSAPEPADFEASPTIEPAIEPAIQSEPQPPSEPIVIEAALPAASDGVDLRQVAGDRVNMRAGPGTGYRVMQTLVQGTLMEVLQVDAAGWARVRVGPSGVEGWMAERLLAPAG